MSSKRIGRRMLVVAGGTALVTLGVTTAACGTSGNQAPSTTTTTTTTTAPSSTPPPSPTEKSINPTGGNLFTPPVHAPAAPSVPAGQHPGINGIP
jgi:hypothetical protein